MRAGSPGPASADKLSGVVPMGTVLDAVAEVRYVMDRLAERLAASHVFPESEPRWRRSR
jgi:hypothetical protein